MSSLSNVAVLVRSIVVALVDFPNEVEVTEVVGQSLTVIEVKTRPSDIGKVIGRRGVTADSIRDLLGPLAHGKRRYDLVVVDPGV